jgi:hypothetical protein
MVTGMTDRQVDKAAPLPASKQSAAAHWRPPEGMAAGETARTKAPRASHGLLEPSLRRSHPIGPLQRQPTSRRLQRVANRYRRTPVPPLAFCARAADDERQHTAAERRVLAQVGR